MGSVGDRRMVHVPARQRSEEVSGNRGLCGGDGFRASAPEWQLRTERGRVGRSFAGFPGGSVARDKSVSP